MRRRRKRPRCLYVGIQRANFEHLPAILALCRIHGEGKVDIRDLATLQKAILDGLFHIFISLPTGEIIGCAAVYPYRVGSQRLNELGTNLFMPAWRGLGLADVSVAFRSLDVLVSEPGSICVSELYLDSAKSKAVLERNGYVEVQPDEGRAAHAAAVSPEPVRHMELQLSAVPHLAALLLEVVRGVPLVRDDLHLYVQFIDSYWLRTPSGLRLLTELAAGDLSSISAAGEEAKPGVEPDPAPPPPAPRPPKRTR